MKSYQHKVYIANTLKYIYLLPQKEQKIKEYETMSQKIRSVNRKGQYDYKHFKLTKKILTHMHICTFYLFLICISIFLLTLCM